MLESLVNKVVGLKEINFMKKRLQHRFFFYEICEILKTPFLQNISSGCFWKDAVASEATEAVARMCSAKKKVILKISRNS